MANLRPSPDKGAKPGFREALLRAGVAGGLCKALRGRPGGVSPYPGGATNNSPVFSSRPQHFHRAFCDRFVWPALGLLLVVGLWWLAVHGLGRDSLMAARFSPENTGRAMLELASGPDIWRHALASLQRVAFGLGIALLVGIPLGLLVGSWPTFNRLTSTTFQFLRMISPLSWMPIAVMALGVGEAPVVFLIVFAAVWPIVLNVAAGIQAIDPQWLTLADSMGANRRERLWHVTVPAIAAHLLTGIRLAIGLIWVVLVPAEMLGVNAGLGYFILDTRDRMAYGELMACVLFIGLLGFLLDWLARLAHRRWSGA